MVHVILCRPEGSANIGSVCRAMQAMKLHSLILAGAHEIDEQEVRKWSLKAYGIYEKAQHFPDLASAIAPMAWVVGASRRHGRHRKRYFLTPEDVAAQLPQYGLGPVALVFGNEKNGLNEHELRLCQSLLTIPADDENGSLNLSHAVQICAYALFRGSVRQSRNAFAPATQKEADDMISSLVRHMDEQGIFRAEKPGVKELTYSRLYDIFGRIPLHKADIKFLRHTFDKMIYAPRKTHEVLNNNLPKEGE